MREVKIEWTGPFDPKKVKKNEGNIYQFYGYHPVYGKDKDGKDKDVLLYICGAYEWSEEEEKITDHKNISRKRIPVHFNPEKIKVVVGKIFDDNEKKVCLEIIKEILVFLHSPAWNTEGIDDIRVSRAFCKDVVICNLGCNVGKEGGLLEKVKGEDCFCRKR